MSHVCSLINFLLTSSSRYTHPHGMHTHFFVHPDSCHPLFTPSHAHRHSVHQQSWPSQCGRSSSAATAVLGPRSAAVVPSSRPSSSSSYLPAEADQAPCLQSRTNRLSAEQTQLCPNPDLCWRGAGPPQKRMERNTKMLACI
ncbi:hypothetical protein TYRP_017973 [Tyrophagus putrescentiae]|nr:hypothetical protein TYRP_017973 [Tyrophagus putrescentiae]